MKLTKEKTIELHRAMWNYMAIETLKQGRIIGKNEAIINCLDMNPDDLAWWCPCCDYAFAESGFDSSKKCDKCPLIWPDGCCIDNKCEDNERDGHLFARWENAYFVTKNIRLAAELAQQIANLPVKDEVF